MHAKRDNAGVQHLLLRGVASDVQEVGWGAAMHLDDVHGRHGQPRSIHHAADVAVQADVVQVVLPSSYFPAQASTVRASPCLEYCITGRSSVALRDLRCQS